MTVLPGARIELALDRWRVLVDASLCDPALAPRVGSLWRFIGRVEIDEARWHACQIVLTAALAAHCRLTLRRQPGTATGAAPVEPGDALACGIRIRARTAGCIDGLDLELFTQALEMRRRFLAEHYGVVPGVAPTAAP